MVALRGRRLGDIDRVRARKGLLQPLLQCLVQPALLGAFGRFGVGVGARSGHRCLLVPRGDFADAASMLDEPSSRQIQEGPEAFMKHITCIEDLRQLHMRRMPKAFFDYADRGSYSEDTLRANRADLEAIKFRQRILVDVSKRDLSTTILGEPGSMPLILAPVGLLGMQHGDGEILACRAAQAAGIPFCLSTMSICSIEDVAAAVAKPFWFQLYVMKDRGFVRGLIGRAAAAKCSALVLTVDLQVLGQRHRDIKNGLTVPPEMRIRNIIEIATKPAWALSIARGKRRTFGNLAGHVRGMEDVNSLAEWTNGQFDASLRWKNAEWITSL